MKVLWLCNIVIPKIAREINVKPSVGGGWLTGLSNDLLERQDIELIVGFPIKSREMIRGNVGKMSFYGFPNDNNILWKYSNSIEECFIKILREVKPDIVHIFGTEYPHTLAMTNACIKEGIQQKMIINIQGLVSIYAKHFMANLPHNVTWKYSFRDVLKCENLMKRKKTFEKRGKLEIEAIKNTQNIIGRTDWDRACVTQLNPDVNYYFCNETLRDEFYKHHWKLENCERNSIFVSQASYPIKGLHYLLEAMPLILKKYPDTKLYIAGSDITKSNTFKEKIKMTYYGRYISSMIKKFKLEKNIYFIGNLNEVEMSNMFLKAHVFVSPSSIENSPNSVGEAGLIGTPIITSDVGGVKNLITHELEGYIYQHDAPYMLAYYICKVFSDDMIAKKLSSNAKIRANITHDRQKNSANLIDIYNKISQ